MRHVAAIVLLLAACGSGPANVADAPDDGRTSARRLSSCDVYVDGVLDTSWRGTRSGRPVSLVRGGWRYDWRASDGGTVIVDRSWNGRPWGHLEQSYADGHVVREVDVDGDVRTWSWDGDVLVGYGVGDGSDLDRDASWSYDGAGRLASVNGKTFHYADDGRLLGWTALSGDAMLDLTVSRWDAAGLPIEGASGESVNDDTYEIPRAWTWDAAGRLTSETAGDTRWTYGWIDLDDGGVRFEDDQTGVAYEWDALGRLVSEERGDVAGDLFYDDVGTLREMSGTGPTTSLEGDCPRALWQWFAEPWAPPPRGPFPEVPTHGDPLGFAL